MNPRTRRALEFVLDNLVWFMLLFVLVVFSIFVPNYFQLGIFANIIEASSVLGVMSIGLALVIIAGHMDLSVESVAALERHGGRHPLLLRRHRHRPRIASRVAGGAGLAAACACRRRL